MVERRGCGEGASGEVVEMDEVKEDYDGGWGPMSRHDDG